MDGLAGYKGRAREMLVNAGMTDHKKQYPSVLPGGMRQRIALLTTLLEERPVILMDEPFSILDALTRQNGKTSRQNIYNSLFSGF